MFSHHVYQPDRKNFSHEPKKSNFLYPELQEKILHALFCGHYFQKVTLNIHLISRLLWQLIVDLNPDFNFCKNFLLSWIDDVTAAA